MEKVRIIIDEQTLELTRLELTQWYTISGVIYVQLGDFMFPSKRWDDLCASILAMWLEAVGRHLLGREDMAILYFMDGDYSLELTYQNPQQSLMRFMGPNEVCMLESEIDIRYFARQMLAATAKIIDKFPEHRKCKNIQEIAEWADKLRDILRRTRSLPQK